MRNWLIVLLVAGVILTAVLSRSSSSALQQCKAAGIQSNETCEQYTR
jgi:hypothetical protein